MYILGPVLYLTLYIIIYRRSGNFRWDKFSFLMFVSFNFRRSALPMKIKPCQKFNAYCTISEEVACSRIQRLDSQNAHRAMAVFILRTCQLFDALIM